MARSADSRWQKFGANVDEGAHPGEGRRFGEGEGWSNSAISAALDTSVNNVARTRQLLVEEGFEATLSRKHNPTLPGRGFDGAEAKLIALACSPAPQGFARWSLSPKRKSSN